MDIRRITTHLNQMRARHGSPGMKYSSIIAHDSQAYANKGVFQHSGNRKYGENLAQLWAGHGDTVTDWVIKSLDMWYEEAKHYDYAHPGFKHGIGHFTAMVWAESTEFGFGVHKGPDGKIIVVMNIAKPGNVCAPGYFERNVKRPR